MRKFSIIPVFLFLLIMTAFRNDKPAYVLYNREGKTVSYSQMLRRLSEADIILFGEQHNDPISHWMELNLEKDLFEEGKSMVMGAEMLEADNQLILDEFMKGIIKASDFEKEARLWDNYDTDYKPLLDFARDKKIRFVATNIPRRYAAIVSRKSFGGLDCLSGEAKSYIAPLPVPYDPDLPGYKNMRSMMDMHEGMGMHMNPDYFAEAQAIKDATMAYFILKNYSPGTCFLHFNGAYHSNNFEGIVWYLKKSNPDLKIMTLTTVEQNDPSSLESENKGLADFTIAVPNDMTKTF